MPVGLGAQTCVPEHPPPTRAGGAHTRPSVSEAPGSVVDAAHAAGGAGGVTATKTMPFPTGRLEDNGVHAAALALMLRESVVPPVQPA